MPHRASPKERVIIALVVAVLVVAFLVRRLGFAP